MVSHQNNSWWFERSDPKTISQSVLTKPRPRLDIRQVPDTQMEPRRLPEPRNMWEDIRSRLSRVTETECDLVHTKTLPR